MKAMAKCAEQMGPDTPADIVNAVATGAMSVILKGVEGVSNNVLFCYNYNYYYYSCYYDLQ